jgi:general secretion pathway protein D
MASSAQRGATEIEVEDGMVQLDFNDVELTVVIDTISKLTGTNFIYDDRVRGRVTIVSPSKISTEQAYAVFESVLQVKGFTTVRGPGGVVKVIPIREAKESNIETMQGRRRPPNSDRFITRLIPLDNIDAEAIAATLNGLVSKDASMVAYGPTNTIILTDSASNIRRILTILESIDVETFKEELTVIKVRHADATSLAAQLQEIFGADVSATNARPQPVRRARGVAGGAAAVAPNTADTIKKGHVRVITDDRTNSLIVLASRQRLAELREVISRLDVPVTGGGRIHVYYLRHADAEELAETLISLIAGQPAPSAGGGGAAGGAPQNQAALRAAITELSEGVTVTADPPTNALVIQASQEGFSTLSQVVAQLDIARPQVLVEALIMEVDVSDGEDLGFSGIGRIMRGDSDYSIGSVTDAVAPGLLSGAIPGTGAGNIDNGFLNNLIAAATRDTTVRDADGNIVSNSGSIVQGIIRAAASDNRTNVLSAPHVLTSDNEEAEIRVGAEIPIVTGRIQSAQGNDTGLSTSQNIERQDIGVTLRVTPQISEGESVRLEIFQEITDVNTALSAVTGNPEEVGVSLSKRNVENTVVVGDSDTVVIGGLISDDYTDNVNKVPWLGDIPVLGWAFKTTSRQLQKVNLLIFLTPHIVRNSGDLAGQSIRKREEFWERSSQSLRLSDAEREERAERRADAAAAGIDLSAAESENPVIDQLRSHSKRYPVSRMNEIRENRDKSEDEVSAESLPGYTVLAAVFQDEQAASALMTELVDAGYDGQLVSSETNGVVLMQVRLGPYENLEQAEEVSGTVREAFGVNPSVVVERPERDG